MPRSCGFCGSGNLVSLNERETPPTCEGVLALHFLKHDLALRGGAAVLQLSRALEALDRHRQV